MVAADARTAITFALSPGQAQDAVEGRRFLGSLDKLRWPGHLVMDRAAPTREMKHGNWRWTFFIPVVPPKANRTEPWEYVKVMYRRRNEIERLFRRLKGFRRSFSRFEKLDVMFTGFIHFALIVEELKLC